MPQEIQVGRFSGLLHKLLGMREGSPAPYLAPDIIATLVLEADRPEWLYLAGTRLAYERIYQANSAGEVSYVWLDNPTDSGVVGTVERWWAHEPAAYLHFRSSGSVGAGASGFQLDTRSGVWPALIGATMRMGGAAAAAIPGTDMTQFYALQGVEQHVPFVLGPGSSIYWVTPNVNTAISIGVQWRERAIESSER